MPGDRVIHCVAAGSVLYYANYGQLPPTTPTASPRSIHFIADTAYFLWPITGGEPLQRCRSVLNLAEKIRNGHLQRIYHHTISS
jgi:hypothetical protein